MWKTHFINGFKCQVKVYDEGSEFGIDGGRISKLFIYKDSTVYANYDRGWDILPDTDEAVTVYETLLKMYN